MLAICSYNKRPMTQNGNRSYFLKTGESAWGRDVYHLVNPDAQNRTLCGRDTYGWVEPWEQDEIDHHCCERCRNKADG